MLRNSSESRSDDQPSMGEDWRKQVGLPPRIEYLKGPPPRPVDENLIRALHLDELDGELKQEVRWLTLTFLEWAEAQRRVLRELISKADWSDLEPPDEPSTKTRNQD